MKDFYTELLKGNILSLYNFTSIINNPVGPKKKHCLEIAIKKNNNKLFLFLLEQGADPLLSTKAILKSKIHLEYILDIHGAGLNSPVWFPIVCLELERLRGISKVEFSKTLAKFDYPIPHAGTWRCQNSVESITNLNIKGLRRNLEGKMLYPETLREYLGYSKAMSFIEGEKFINKLLSKK